MKKLLSLGIAAALLLPVATGQAAAVSKNETVFAVGHNAKNLPMHQTGMNAIRNIRAVASHRTVRPVNFMRRIGKSSRKHVFPGRLIYRCLVRVSIRKERLKLLFAGYRKVRYLGRKVYKPRCAQFLYFSACKAGKRYQVIVRYIRHRRFVITRKVGLCLRLPHRPVFRAPAS